MIVHSGMTHHVHDSFSAWLTPHVLYFTLLYFTVLQVLCQLVVMTQLVEPRTALQVVRGGGGAAGWEGGGTAG